MVDQNKYLAYSYAGLCCTLIGIGLSRFAYTPILPLMVKHQWLTSLQAGYLGAINFLGYLLGAMLARFCIQLLGDRKSIDYALIACTLSIFLCALPLGEHWLYFWRLVAGFSGAVLTVAAPTLIFSNLPHSLKGRASGIIFSGVGIGIILSGLLIPYISQFGLSFTWFVVGLIALLALLYAWFNLPQRERHEEMETQNFLASLSELKWPVILLSITYFFGAAGFTPHSLFLVAWMTFHFHFSVIYGGFCWALFGIGAVIGTIGFGFAADRLGFPQCLMSVYTVAMLLIVVILVTNNMIILASTSFLMGMLFLSTVSLSSAQLSKLVTHHAYPSLWGMLTSLFALSQTATAFVISHFMQTLHGFLLTFLLALVTLFIAAVAGAGLCCKHTKSEKDKN